MDPAAPTLARSDRADVEPRPRRREAVAVRSVGLLASVVLLAVVVLASLAIGSVSIPWPTVIDSLVAFDGSNEHLIVRTLRLPRTIIGLGVGSALAVAGVAMQAVTRNVLASPTILGVNAGAAFAIVAAVFVLDVVTAAMYLWFAFAGALVVSALVHGIAAAGRGGATPIKLALAGAVMTALLSSWTSGILVFNQQTLDEVRFWFAGSIAGRDLDVFWQVLPFLAVGLVAVALLARQFDTLALGDDVATSLGQRTGRVRVVATLAFVVLAGGAVAVAGPIGFVGLAVPHVVRGIVGSEHRWLVPWAAVHGAALLLAADIVGRVVMRPSEIHVGIVTALVGAPVLIHLVRSRRLVDL